MTASLYHREAAAGDSGSALASAVLRRGGDATSVADGGIIDITLLLPKNPDRRSRAGGPRAGRCGSSIRRRRSTPLQRVQRVGEDRPQTLAFPVINAIDVQVQV